MIDKLDSLQKTLKNSKDTQPTLDDINNAKAASWAKDATAQHNAYVQDYAKWFSNQGYTNEYATELAKEEVAKSVGNLDKFIEDHRQGNTNYENEVNYAQMQAEQEAKKKKKKGLAKLTGVVTKAVGDIQNLAAKPMAKLTGIDADKIKLAQQIALSVAVPGVGTALTALSMADAAANGNINKTNLAKMGVQAGASYFGVDPNVAGTAFTAANEVNQGRDIDAAAKKAAIEFAANKLAKNVENKYAKGFLENVGKGQSAKTAALNSGLDNSGVGKQIAPMREKYAELKDKLGGYRDQFNNAKNQYNNMRSQYDNMKNQIDQTKNFVNTNVNRYKTIKDNTEDTVESWGNLRNSLRGGYG